MSKGNYYSNCQISIQNSLMRLNIIKICPLTNGQPINFNLVLWCNKMTKLNYTFLQMSNSPLS